MCYTIPNDREGERPRPGRESEMFLATVKTATATYEKSFDLMGSAIQWVRSFAFDAVSVAVYQNGTFYYGF